MAFTPIEQKFLFGGDKSWNSDDWTASDDRVRNGSSISYLTIDPSLSTAEFNGNLDINTLGGAGFASQRTTGESRNWNLSRYDGIQLDIAKADGKRYTLTVKDQLLPRGKDGRIQSTISWEYDFTAKKDGEKIFLAWEDLNPTYRGRDVDKPTPLDLKSVKRISLLMRSFFGAQEGDFSLNVTSISAVTKSTDITNSRYRDDPNEEVVRSSSFDEKSQRVMNEPKGHRWLGWFRDCLS